MSGGSGKYGGKGMISSILKNSEDEWPSLGQNHGLHLGKLSQACEPDLDIKTRSIEQTQKMIEKLEQDENQIIQLLKNKLIDQDELNSLLKSTLRYREEDVTRSTVRNRGELHRLQVARDKLCCVNKAYRVAGTIFSGGELNTLTLHHKMLHKTKTIAEEKQLIREVTANQSGMPVVDPYSMFKRVDTKILELYTSMAWARTSTERKQVLREIKELEVERDNMISNANVKGKIWDTLGSKEAIQNRIKDINIDLDGKKKKQLLVKAEIKRASKEMKAMDKCVILLYKKLATVYREKDVRHKHLLELRKREKGGV